MKIKRGEIYFVNLNPVTGREQSGKRPVLVISTNELGYYIMYLPELEALHQLTRAQFKQVHDEHWQIECFHRVIKQVCNTTWKVRAIAGRKFKSWSRLFK